MKRTWLEEGSGGGDGPHGTELRIMEATDHASALHVPILVADVLIHYIWRLGLYSADVSGSGNGDDAVPTVQGVAGALPAEQQLWRAASATVHQRTSVVSLSTIRGRTKL